MITGSVTARNEAVVVVFVRDSRDAVVPIDVVIDTGFTGFLTLPTSVIEHLGLSFAGSTEATLADGSEISLGMFITSIRWDDADRDVIVLAADGDPLLGMGMLAGHRVVMDVRHRGDVTITPLT